MIIVFGGRFAAGEKERDDSASLFGPAIIDCANAIITAKLFVKLGAH
jgi:hypothetical protein